MLEGLFDDEGKVKGSTLVLGFTDSNTVEEYLVKELYVTEGVWEKVEVVTMDVVLVNGESK